MAGEVLTIGGVEMPTPAMEGVKVSREKIWSANTGRSSSGKMLGTVVAVKTKISVTFPPLTLSQARKVENAVANGYFSVKLTRNGDTVFNGTMYGGTPVYTVYSMAEGMPYAKGFSVDLIER